MIAELVRVTRRGGWIELVEGGSDVHPVGAATDRMFGLAAWRPAWPQRLESTRRVRWPARSQTPCCVTRSPSRTDRIRPNLKTFAQSRDEGVLRARMFRAASRYTLARVPLSRSVAAIGRGQANA